MNDTLNRFKRRWSTPNYKRMMCLEESFYKDYAIASTFYVANLKQLDNANYFKFNSQNILNNFVSFQSIVVQINNKQPTLSFNFNKNINGISGNFNQIMYHDLITIPLFHYCNKVPETIEEGINLIKQLIKENELISVSILHEYFHFLFENGLSTEEFKMFNDKTMRSEFNSFTKELMVQLLSSNEDKHFNTEEDLKRAYENFKDKLETKKNLLQFCNDEKLILDTLIKYNKDFELKEASETRWQIDLINLQSEPLYSTTFEELEQFTQMLENSLGNTRKQIVQSILDMANKN